MKKNIYIKRRELFFKTMKELSIAIFFSAPIVYRNSDSNYPYRQDSDFWYLTGYSEPESALMIIKYNCNHNKFIFFNRTQDKIMDTWFGKCLDKNDIINFFGMHEVLSFSEIKNYLLHNLYKFNIIYHAYGKFNYSDDIIYSTIKLLCNYKYKQYKLPIMQIDWRPILHEMRLFKSNEEINDIRKSVEISSNAHYSAMKICKPNIYEYHIAAEIEYQFAIHGANSAYTVIAAAGNNACTLHYTKKNSILKNGDLILIDAGAEYNNYATDITRTLPINGKFTKHQRDIYDIVLSALNIALSLYKPGIKLNEVLDIVIKTKIDGLVKLGILHGEIDNLIESKAYLPFFMHSLNHWIGLDVHDVGNYGANYDRILQPGMILSVEPGLYINLDADVPDVYKGIGVRIEDTILITKHGNINLSSNIINDPNEIELFMKTYVK